jgi:uncharacterized DUF497 family protein
MKIETYNSLIVLIENMVRKQLLNEGGGGGHMDHPYELGAVKIEPGQAPEIEYVIKNGPELLKLFEDLKKSLESPSDPIVPGLKVDGVNTSIRLIDSKSDFSVEGKTFVLDRGSQEELDKKGVTMEDAVMRFPDKVTLKDEDGKTWNTTEKRVLTVGNEKFVWLKSHLEKGDKITYLKTKKPRVVISGVVTDVLVHPMISATQVVLGMLNKNIKELKPELERLGMWDNSQVAINAEYVLKSTNVKEYLDNFIALHDIGEYIEAVTGRIGKPKRVKKSRDYDQDALDKMAEILRPTGAETLAPGEPEKLEDGTPNQKGTFKIYSKIPTRLSGKIDYNEALNEGVEIDEGNAGPVTKTLKDWVEGVDHNPILDKDYLGHYNAPLPIHIFDPKKDKMVIKEERPLSLNILRWVILNKEDVKKLVGYDKVNWESLHGKDKRKKEEELHKAQKRIVDGAVLVYATMKLGQIIKKALESELGGVGGEEGIVVKDLDQTNERGAVVGTYPPFKVTGNFIVGKEETPFDKRGEPEVAEKESADPPKIRTAIFPGSFKPPHRGHMSVIQHLIDEHNPEKVIIFISNPDPKGKNVRSAKITPAKAKKIFDEYVKAMNFTVPIHTVVSPAPQSIKTAYDYIETKAENNEEVLLATSMADPGRYAGPYLKKSVEKNPNANVTARAIEAPTCKDEECDAADKISAGDIRRIVDGWVSMSPEEREKGKQLVFSYMPDMPIERKEVVFRELIGETPQEVEEPKSELEEFSGAGSSGGGLSGHSKPLGQIEESVMNKTIYNMQESKLTIEEDVLKQYLVEHFTKQYKNSILLNEGPGERVKTTFGVAQMTQGLGKILDQIYNQHYFNLDLPEERESFIAHFVDAVMSALAQVDSLLAWKRGESELPAKEAEAGVEAAAADIEAGDEAAEAVAEEPIAATDLEEANPEGELEEITLDIEDEEKADATTSAEDILSGKKLPELPTDIPPEIASMNAQGAAQAQLAFHNNGKQLIDAYRGIVDPNPGTPNYEKELAQAKNYREGFKDSFLTNFGLWADRWKIQTDSTAQARTTPDLEAIRKERDASIIQPGAAPAAAPAPAAPALEESQMADIIKQSIIKTFRKLDYK